MRMIVWAFDVLKTRILAQIPREEFIFGPTKSTRKRIQMLWGDEEMVADKKKNARVFWS